MSEDKKWALPLLIVKPGTVSKRDIARAEKSAFILIVECVEPESVRFLAPPPPATLSDQAAAAMELMRVVLRADAAAQWTSRDLARSWSRILTGESAPRGPEKVKP